MCLIAFAWQTRPDLPLVLASNRDEFFDRPTAPADWWQPAPDGPKVLSGRDLQAGGTWMGVSATGRFAALTNFRAPNERKPEAPSRGPLVANFLGGDTAPGDYLRGIAGAAAAYNGFSLIAGDLVRRELWIYSNRAGSAPRRLEPGVYGLSNALLDTPWPKLLALRGRLHTALAEQSPDLVAHLLATLADPNLAPEPELPSTGIDPELEKVLSAIFIVPAVRQPGGPAYGTRTSTILTVAAAGPAVFHERNFDTAGGATERAFRFSLPVPAAPR